jgi:hypothetical protein
MFARNVPAPDPIWPGLKLTTATVPPWEPISKSVLTRVLILIVSLAAT